MMKHGAYEVHEGSVEDISTTVFLRFVGKCKFVLNPTTGEMIDEFLGEVFASVFAVGDFDFR